MSAIAIFLGLAKAVASSAPDPHRPLVSPVRLGQTGQSKGALMHERPRRDPADYQKNRVSQVLLSI